MNIKNLFLNETKKQLDEIGPGMCLAKWTQTTLHLGVGHTHSCHHPKTHIIPISEIKKNPSALHNTSAKKLARQEMMTGSRPSECHYCWNVEDSAPAGAEVYSDRVYKSNDSWSKPYFNKVKEVGYTGDINPAYLEVSFNYACNFKCAYCSPEISSKWMEEIKQFGPYPTSRKFNSIDHVIAQNKMPIAERDENPYVDAFWEWWPDLYPTLHTFRITGGEPLMTKHTFRVLDYIIEHPNKDLELAINTNCVVEDKLFDKFIEKLKIIESQRLVKSVTVYTSCEAFGAKAEYIRNGLDYNKWFYNCCRILREVPTLHFAIMSTYNALSVTSYKEFLQDVLILKRNYRKPGREITIDIPYLDHPKFMNVGILPKSYKPMIEEQIEYMKSNQIGFFNRVGFKETEIAKLERIQYLFQDTPEVINQKDFYLFFTEHDKRRATDFLATFPEMAEFYAYCRSLFTLDNK